MQAMAALEWRGGPRRKKRREGPAQRPLANRLPHRSHEQLLNIPSRPPPGGRRGSYQLNFTPNFAIRGGSTVVAFSKAAPARQLMLIAVFEFIRL